MVHHCTEGAFTNYVDETRWVGGTGNVNDMHIIPYNSREILSTNVNPVGRWSKKGQNLVNIVKECPLMS